MAKYQRDDYIRFLDTERVKQEDSYYDLVSKKATLLKSRGEVFVGKFQKMNAAGIALFLVRRTENMPRKNSFWTACYFIDGKWDYRNWENLSWLDLRSDFQRRYSDATCVFLSKADDPRFCLVGISGLTCDFASILQEDFPIIAFGPKDPPLKYLLNLRDLCEDTSSPMVNKVLDMEMSADNWAPTFLDSTADFPLVVEEKISSGNVVAVQGPPGTGKTHRIALYVQKLLDEGHSVLVTALTNRALMEVAEKDSLKSYLSMHRISKTSLTIDEQKELPELQRVIDNKCNAAQGYLTLASFYISSGWALEAEVPPFDYVIMDEASQALLPMIAASYKLGNRVLWIGDQCQLPPIVETVEEDIVKNGWKTMIEGFDTVCNYLNPCSYMLCDSYRLPDRAVKSTGVFYNNCLRSVSKIKEVPSSLPFVNKEGGPVLIDVLMQEGKKAPTNAFETILRMVKQLLCEKSDYKIAVLSKFRETTRKLHEFFVMNWDANELPINLKIETVDRVQGTTEDFCFFLIPNASFIYSVDRPLFNVATSRAQYNTFIVVSKDCLKRHMPEEVRNYFNSFLCEL